jgi:TolB-like protein/class 3 adenylate cyclase
VSDTRKLAAILAADVVGYSRLMGEDEAGTAKIVRERREAAIPIVRSFGGRLVKTMGDGVLLEFPSVVAAVDCAIAIQKIMAERNATVTEAKRILYRVGVNLGDILIDGEDILGDGVNVAARLEAICEPGGVCLSSSAYEQVRDRLKESFADLGEKSLKNIARPVRVYVLSTSAIAATRSGAETSAPARKASGLSPRLGALAAALLIAIVVAGGYTWRAGFAPRFMAASVDDKLANAPHLSIVVLPFENLSGDKEQEYFADGITEDLTTDLSHLQDAFVIARGTAFTYKGKPIDAKHIGKDLGVRYVLEGSARRVGETITVNAQLISTETGAQVWADRFEGERSKLGELQVEAVSRLANSLRVELVKAEALGGMRERPSNPDAVDLTMRGWVERYRPESKASEDAAIGLFERALAIDPHLVAAMVGLAWSLADRVRWLHSDDPKSDIARAEDWAERAVAAAPDNSAAHMAKATVFFSKRQWPQAIAEDEAAIADNPNNAQAHAGRGFSKLHLGRSEDGFSGLETAFRLSPRDLDVPIWQFNICVLHNFLAQWEQGIEWCEKARAGAPENVYALVHLAAANAWAGHDTEAKDAAAQLQRVSPGFTMQTWAGLRASDDPTYIAQRARIAEGLRKAGVPEGEKKPN